jgi:hypothetical protein
MATTPTRFIEFGIKDTNSGTTNFLSKLLEDKQFDYSITRYPLNLGGQSQGRSHYIVFHILEQRKSQYSTEKVTGVDAGESSIANEQAAARDGRYQFVQNYGDAVDVVVKGIQDAYNWTGAPTATSDIGKQINEAATTLGNEFATTVKEASKLSFLRTVTKTSETIALYMPDTLSFVQPQGYADLELGNSLDTMIFAGGKGVVDAIRAGSGADFAKNLSPFLQNYVGNKVSQFTGGNLAKAITIAGQGIVTNPIIEVIYTSPGLRHFRFDFMFYPESQKEAFAVQKIIQLFQFHQAPEIASGTGGYFLVPPSEFDIEFYYNGKENINLPVISTCVLTSVDVDYAPNGWSAYEIPGEDASIGGSGMPVATKLSLEFREASIVTKSSRQFDKAPINKPTTTSTPSINAATLRANLDKAAGK